ncbi:DUF3179 domain-containing protein [Pontibacter sp. G13]|uniref:DUF3179 domain-containing protein n=1 Tax=Pontibacter sp. G13 TaxID=3074898 RepID=UPI002889BBFE|nr:DUF3179 domain-containing protein [Pontibacter sp. G13]WNJ18120.1 DUF3179 domain-containing protein [Pontibacter sp. G13]
MNVFHRLGMAVVCTCLIACTPESVQPDTPSWQLDWLIPLDEIVDGGVGKDGIEALNLPPIDPLVLGSYQADEEHVLGIELNGQARAYPVKMLDWHEIINDTLAGEPISIIYCPLTGTGTAWSRVIDGKVSTFGISGLLHQSNVIPYDRETDSNWSQMRGECVQGSQVRQMPDMYPLVMTSWGEWKRMYPETSIISANTGYDNEYNFYPYFDYRENHLKLPFPINHDDPRVDRKVRVFGVVAAKSGPKSHSKAYPMEVFGEGVKVFQEIVGPEEVVVVGSHHRDFAIAFKPVLEGDRLVFSPVPNGGKVVMADEEGNRWDLMGHCVSGPRTGKQLTLLEGYVGYWFAWATFHPDLFLEQ